MNEAELQRIDWKKGDGLLPAVIQDADTRQVLMVGYLNEAALGETLKQGEVTFFSRSKHRLWTKGESSGNRLELVGISLDCDGDTFLITARPKGPTCHLGTYNCFGQEKETGSSPLTFLNELSSLIDQRFVQRPVGSYTTQLFEAGVDRMAQKVGEEGVEVVIAAKNEATDPLLGEAADLVFHLMVLLRSRGLSLAPVVTRLKERHAPKDPVA